MSAAKLFILSLFKTEFLHNYKNKLFDFVVYEYIAKYFKTGPKWLPKLTLSLLEDIFLDLFSAKISLGTVAPAIMAKLSAQILSYFTVYWYTM